MDGFVLDILVLAMIAAFVLFRLWSTLGRRTGHERSPEARPDPLPGPSAEPAARQADPIEIGGPARRAPVQVQPAPADGPLARAVADIQAADRGFEVEAFLQGAVQAHEMIVEAFARNDRASLRPFLGDAVFEAFDAVMRERDAKGARGEVVFVRQGAPRLQGARLTGRTARLDVRFESEIVSSVKDRDGRVIEGSDTAVRTVVDLWGFERDVRSPDPNWKLVDTDTSD